MKKLTHFLKESMITESKVKDLVEFCKEYIFDWLDDNEGTTHYGCDLGYTITDDDNRAGRVFVYDRDAKEAWDLWYPNYIDDYLDYLKEYDFDPHDYLEQEFEYDDDNEPVDYEWVPKDYNIETCRMVIWIVNDIVSRCKVVNKNWNDEFELTPKVIKDMKNEIKRMK